jgi:redox-sensitive bicupin YhaK (pirin superfamily)
MEGPEVEIIAGKPTNVGGMVVHRMLPTRGRRHVGAWCFLDRMGPHDVAEHAMLVGPHPHIGLHTVTWLFEGVVEHTDSLGSRQLIHPGQLNLMTAGHGIAHAEDGRAQSSGPLNGVQLWVAQPESTRHGAASFAHFAELPQVMLGAVSATVLLGAFAGAASPAQTDAPTVGVELVGDGLLELPLEPTYEYALAVASGQAEVGGVQLSVNEMGFLGLGHQSLPVRMAAGSRALLLGGPPFEEDIVMWWNFVGRSRAELEQAGADWQEHAARFGSVDSSLEWIAPPHPYWIS